MSLLPRSFFPSRGVFDLDSFFEPGISQALWPSTRNLTSELETFSPRIEVREKENTYEITAEIPGVNKEDISLDLQNGVLTLKAETKQESKEEKDGKVVRQERRYGTYYRSFDLGSDIQESDIHADFNNGVLKIVAPRVEKETLQSRRISIN